jgi:hypothetical protein
LAVAMAVALNFAEVEQADARARRLGHYKFTIEKRGPDGSSTCYTGWIPTSTATRAASTSVPVRVPMPSADAQRQELDTAAAERRAAALLAAANKAARNRAARDRKRKRHREKVAHLEHRLTAATHAFTEIVQQHRDAASYSSARPVAPAPAPESAPRTPSHAQSHTHGASGRQWLNQHARRYNNWQAERDWRADQHAGFYGTYSSSSTRIGQGAGVVWDTPEVAAAREAATDAAEEAAAAAAAAEASALAGASASSFAGDL